MPPMRRPAFPARPRSRHPRSGRTGRSPRSPISRAIPTSATPWWRIAFPRASITTAITGSARAAAYRAAPRQISGTRAGLYAEHLLDLADLLLDAAIGPLGVAG